MFYTEKKREWTKNKVRIIHLFCQYLSGAYSLIYGSIHFFLYNKFVKKELWTPLPNEDTESQMG